ncbi:MAG: gamma-glutamylcyclotransferase family protein [Nitriliruptoraceae bacterium]
MPSFDPRSYPGPRASGPVLVHDGRVVALDLDVWAAGTAAPVLSEPERISFVVAYGSNAAPRRLHDKRLDVDGAVLLPARLRGYVAAFEARRTGYGAIPLTLVPEPGAVIDTWVLGLLPAATGLLDRTEGRVPEHTPAQVRPELADGRFAPPGTYQLGRVGRVEVAGRWYLEDALAYLPGRATRVQCHDDGRWRTWPGLDQAAAAEHLDRGGSSRPAPPVAAPVLGPWPRTPLRPRS